jgi:hypothetical protein
MMKLVDIEKHPLYPFSDFRTNDASFLMLELYWTSVAQEALGDELSTQVVPTLLADQDKERTGEMPNMLGFWIPNLNKGARIMLAENLENLPQPHEAENRFEAFHPIWVWANQNGVYDESHDLNIGQGIEHIEIAANVALETRNEVSILLRKFFLEDMDVCKINELFEIIQKHRGYPSSPEWDDYYDRMYPDDDE